MAIAIYHARGVQNWLMMGNLKCDPSVLLPRATLKSILGDVGYAAYAAKVQATAEIIAEARKTPVSAGPEAEFYWSAAKKVIIEADRVHRMSEKTAKAKSLKRGASVKLNDMGTELWDLWREVPASDRHHFRKLHVDGDIDDAYIPGLVVQGRTKDERSAAAKKAKASAKLSVARKLKAKLVQDFGIWIIKSEFQADTHLQMSPWPEQVQALVEHFGPDFGDDAPFLGALAEEPEGSAQPATGALDVEATVATAMEKVAAMPPTKTPESLDIKDMIAKAKAKLAQTGGAK